MNELDRMTDTWAFNRRAFFAYVQARFFITMQNEGSNVKSNILEELKLLFEHRAQLSYAARSYVLLAFHLLDPQSSESKQLATDLESEAITTATSAHWQEADT